MNREKVKSSKQKILLVDDRRENLLSLESILENDNLLFLSAQSGEKALKILLREDISLILLDVQMPGMDGFETAKLIRGTQRTRHIPIIFVTAISKEQKHIFKGYESGAVDYLFKPVEPEIVRSKVRIFLELDKQRRLLENQNQQLVSAKRNTDNILTHVEEGIFLLGTDYKIKPQYSKALESILGADQLADIDVRNLLEKRISSGLLESAIDYLDLMFREDLEEAAFVELNPYMDIPYTLCADQATIAYLCFNFKRIYNDRKIEELMVTVTDITEQIILESELKQSKADSQRQVDLLHILKVEPQLLKEFVHQTKTEMNLVQEELQRLTQKDFTEEDINIIYRSMHSVKGNAGLLDFLFIAEKAHQFEEILIGLDFNAKDFADKIYQLQNVLDELNQTLNEISILINHIKVFYEHYDNGQIPAGNLIVKAMGSLIKRLEKELGKKVNFNHKRFDENIVTNKDFLAVKDILIQLTRNSIYHSIEDKMERKKNHKTERAEISLSAETNGKYRIISFQDNGRGIQYDQLKAKAIASKKWTKKELNSWSEQQVAELIFNPGISTSNNTNKVAGRGMGMTIVQKKLEDMNGKIELQSIPGKFCKFKIFLPN